MTKIFRFLLLPGLLLGAASAQTRTVNIGLGYIPNVQFAPFYAADARGYYKAEGLNVTFKHGYVSELMPLLLQGKLDFVVGDAEDAIFARVQGAPVKYVMAMYQKVPVTVFGLPGKGIDSVADLRGKTVGIPGPFGSSYFAFQALLKANKLRESDVKVAPIGFTQLEAVRAGRVDAAVGYINNEVVQLRASGQQPFTLDVSGAYPLVGVGLITTEKTLSGDLARRVVRASQRGLAFTAANPTAAYEIATNKAYAGAGAGGLDVLKASVDLMKSPLFYGNIDAKRWGTAVGFLQSSGQVPKKFKASDFYSAAYLSKTVK